MKHFVHFLDFCEGGKRLHSATFPLLFNSFSATFPLQSFLLFWFFCSFFFLFFLLVLFGIYFSSFWYFLVLLDSSWYFLVFFLVVPVSFSIFQFLSNFSVFPPVSLFLPISSNFFQFLPVFPQFLKTLPQEFGTDCRLSTGVV